MTGFQLIAERINALPCMRGKLRESINASDCVQILIAINQVKTELENNTKQGLNNG